MPFRTSETALTYGWQPLRTGRHYVRTDPTGSPAPSTCWVTPMRSEDHMRMTESPISVVPSLCMGWHLGHLMNKAPSRILRCNRNTWLSRKHHGKPSHMHSSSKNSTFPLLLSLSSRIIKQPWTWLMEQQTTGNQSISTSDITKDVIRPRRKGGSQRYCEWKSNR